MNRFLCSFQAITGSGVLATGLFTAEYQAWNQNYSPLTVINSFIKVCWL
jgi:hypothetical protein